MHGQTVQPNRCRSQLQISIRRNRYRWLLRPGETAADNAWVCPVFVQCTETHPASWVSPKLSHFWLAVSCLMVSLTVRIVVSAQNWRTTCIAILLVEDRTETQAIGGSCKGYKHGYWIGSRTVRSYHRYQSKHSPSIPCYICSQTAQYIRVHARYSGIR